MSMLEQMGIAFILSALQSFVKNPAKKLSMRSVLFSLADDIYEAYGVTPPTHS